MRGWNIGVYPSEDGTQYQLRELRERGGALIEELPSLQEAVARARWVARRRCAVATIYERRPLTEDLVLLARYDYSRMAYYPDLCAPEPPAAETL